MCKQISKKTLTRKIKTLNIFTDANESVKVENNKNIDNLIINDADELEESNGLVSLFPQIKEENIDGLHGLDFLVNVSNDINKKTENDNKFYESVFKPKKIVATKVLIGINIIVFLLTFILSKTNIFDVYTKFALNKYYVQNGEIYRLITCGFLHADIIHLLCNMYSLSIIGTQIENFIGKKKFLIVYFVSLLTGSLLSCILNTGWSVGASGAIFGLMGALVYFGYHYRIYLGSVLKTQLIPLLILNLGIGFIIPNIDISAHIGGLVGGLLTTMSLGIEKKSDKKDALNGTICLITLILFLLFILYMH